MKAKYKEALGVDALRCLAILGENIRQARKARGWSRVEAAERFLMSPHTLAQLENGDPGTGLGAFVMALEVMNLLDGLENVAAPHKDINYLSRRKWSPS